MPAILVLLFVIVPIVEIVVIIQIGQVIGAWWTVLILVADSVLGAVLLKREGARAWRAFRQALEEARWPGDEVTQGALVIVGGTLLLTPGFVTDAVGFLLLLPLTRGLASRTVRSTVRRRVTGNPVGAAGAAGARAASGRRSQRQRRPSSSSTTFDVEVVEIRREPGDRPEERAELIDEGDLADREPDPGTPGPSTDPTSGPDDVPRRPGEEPGGDDPRDGGDDRRA